MRKIADFGSAASGRLLLSAARHAACTRSRARRARADVDTGRSCTHVASMTVRKSRFSRFCTKWSIGESSPFVNGVPSRGARGLDRFVRLTNPTLTSTDTCAQEHGADAEGHQMSAFSHAVYPLGAACVRPWCVVAVRAPDSELPYV